MKKIISREEAKKIYVNGGSVMYGNDVLNSWFEMDGYSQDLRSNIGFETIIKSRDGRNGFNKYGIVEFAIEDKHTPKVNK